MSEMSEPVTHREELSDEKPPPCRFCQGMGSVDGQMCGDCCGLAVDCIDWYQAIAYERLRADRAEATLAAVRKAVAFAPRSMSLGELNAYEAKGSLPFVRMLMDVLAALATTGEPEEPEAAMLCEHGKTEAHDLRAKCEYWDNGHGQREHSPYCQCTPGRCRGPKEVKEEV